MACQVHVHIIFTLWRVFTVSRKAKDAYPTGAAPVPVFGGVQVAHLLVFVPWIMSFRYFFQFFLLLGP
jgi:hypothetical protein